MAKYLLLVLLFLSPNVWADWVSLGVSSIGDSVFIDPSTIRKDGVRRTFWAMSNYGKPTSNGANSARNKYEIDCQKETITLLYITRFPKPMLLGDVLVNGTPEPEAVPIAPNTVNNRFQEIVCSF